VTVEQVFEITGRGLAVLFQGELPSLPLGVGLPARVQRPDGSTAEARAFFESIHWQRPELRERPALLLAGLKRTDVPVGSTVELLEP
jgi:hypothetical protein